MKNKTIDLKIIAEEIRKRVWKLIYDAQSGHTGGDLSSADILTALYFEIMNIDPNDSDNSDRDRYVQSKGHSVEVLWCILKEKGFISEEELETFLKPNSLLFGHPNNKVPGVEMNTGSLGHGLSVGVGMAIAAKMDNNDYKTYVLIGDGELAEGSNWEALMAASKYKLDNLIGIIDRNKLQITACTEDVMPLEPLNEKLKSFGCNVYEIDGNNMEEIIDTLKSLKANGKPHLIIANTVKAKGISFAENIPEWHHKVPNEDEYLKGLEEISNRIEELKNE